MHNIPLALVLCGRGYLHFNEILRALDDFTPYAGHAFNITWPFRYKIQNETNSHEK